MSVELPGAAWRTRRFRDPSTRTSLSQAQGRARSGRQRDTVFSQTETLPGISADAALELVVAYERSRNLNSYLRYVLFRTSAREYSIDSRGPSRVVREGESKHTRSPAWPHCVGTVPSSPMNCSLIRVNSPRSGPLSIGLARSEHRAAHTAIFVTAP